MGGVSLFFVMEKHKRFLVFCYNMYDCGGGLDGLKETFDTLEEATVFLDNRNADIYTRTDFNEIYDRIEGVNIYYEEKE